MSDSKLHVLGHHQVYSTSMDMDMCQQLHRDVVWTMDRPCDLEYYYLVVSTSEHHETCSTSEKVFVHQYSSVLSTFNDTGQALMGRAIIVQ